jgi:hypothetical protein
LISDDHGRKSRAFLPSVPFFPITQDLQRKFSVREISNQAETWANIIVIQSCAWVKFIRLFYGL